MFIEFMPHSNTEHLVLFIRGKKQTGPIQFLILSLPALETRNDMTLRAQNMFTLK